MDKEFSKTLVVDAYEFSDDENAGNNDGADDIEGDSGEEGTPGPDMDEGTEEEGDSAMQ